MAAVADAGRPGPRSSPGRLSRWLYRLPLSLRRLGLGGWERWIGTEWIAITTTGRRSGRPHAVLLDIVGRDPATDTYYVSPAYGRRADWVRNIEVHPIFEAEVDGRRWRARAAAVTGERGAEVLLRFARARPLYARLAFWMTGQGRMQGTDAERHRQLARTMVLAIEPVEPQRERHHGRKANGPRVG